SAAVAETHTSSSAKRCRERKHGETERRSNDDGRIRHSICCGAELSLISCPGTARHRAERRPRAALVLARIACSKHDCLRPVSRRKRAAAANPPTPKRPQPRGGTLRHVALPAAGMNAARPCL